MKFLVIASGGREFTPKQKSALALNGESAPARPRFERADRRALDFTHHALEADALPKLAAYAVNEEPQPQPPVAFGFLKVKPEPITPLT